MSATRTKTRARGQTYTARLQQRVAPAPKRPPRRRVGPGPVLALAAEVGHLAAVFVEWPDSAARGAVHALAAAGLGLVAVALYCGLTRRDLEYAAAIAGLVALAWPVGVMMDRSPYQGFPVLASIALTLGEIALTVLIVAKGRQDTGSR